ncbi:MAG TPA: DUF420 domain-containing protein [Longimicrobiales bacterium]|nr:DUF420 domain-containing protein [Longimicrobiales bacterium]
MDATSLGEMIAPLNAALNFTSFICLTLGFIFIRGGNREAHRKAMMGAVTASVLFLVFYVLRFSLTGTHRFAGEGMARTVYLTVLFSHMILAVVVVPLVLRLLYLAFKERFTEHRRLARWTFPIWMYVSVTGIMVYVMLYQVYGYL